MTKTYQRSDLSIDQRLALKTAATNLQREFAESFGVETIERFLNSSYDEFAGRATIAERSCRCWPSGSPASGCRPWPRSRASPRRAPGGAVPVHPQRRPLADGARVLRPPGWGAGHRLVRRVGTGHEVNPAAVAAMAEVGIDISAEFPKPWTDEVVRAADVVITMGCGDACPVFPGKRYEDWVLEDPAGLDLVATRPDPRRD